MHKYLYLIFIFITSGISCIAQPTAIKAKYDKPLLRIAKPIANVSAESTATDAPKRGTIIEADLHMKFDATDIEMKSVEEGTDAIAIYKFKNIGSETIELQAVTPGCGCTASEYTKEPIKPGKYGIIKAVFHSNGRIGLNQKTIRVISKAGYSKTITFKCLVTKPNTTLPKPTISNK